MKLYEEFNLYESLWDNFSNTLLAESNSNELVDWFNDVGFQGSMKSSYASLQGENDHRLYVKLGSGAPKDVSFQVDGNQATFTYQDLLDITGGSDLVALNQAGIQRIADKFLKLSANNAITSDAAYRNSLKAFVLILACCSAGGQALYDIIKKSSFDRYLNLQINNLASIMEKELKQTNKNLLVDVISSNLTYERGSSAGNSPWTFSATLKVSDKQINKTHEINYTRNVGSYKNLRTILFGFSVAPEEKDKFYRWNLDYALDKSIREILRFFELDTSDNNNEEKTDKSSNKAKKDTANSKKPGTEEKNKDNKDNKEEDSKEDTSEVTEEDKLTEYKKNLDDMNNFLLNSFSEDQNKSLITRAYSVMARALEIIQQYKKGQY
jgi:hypothetical protein